jgi:hypothetical protein
MYFEGSPFKNRYLNEPLKSTLINSLYGINVPCVSPAKQFVRSLTTMNAYLGATSAVNIKQRLIIADYLMFYPFVDGLPEEQILQNTLTLPRYSYGQVIAVCQTSITTEGQFTITYTNQSGVSGRVSKSSYTKAYSTGEGQILSVMAGASQGGNGLLPFISLQEGDIGVSSIQSVTCSVPFTGMMALVIVMPLFHSLTSQSVRQYNSDIWGAADQLNMLIHQAKAPHIIDGATLGIIGQSAESLANTVLTGILETVWK